MPSNAYHNDTEHMGRRALLRGSTAVQLIARQLLLRLILRNVKSSQRGRPVPSGSHRDARDLVAAAIEADERPCPRTASRRARWAAKTREKKFVRDDGIA
jgi:hypothetical protein